MPRNQKPRLTPAPADPCTRMTSAPALRWWRVGRGRSGARRSQPAWLGLPQAGFAIGHLSSRPPTAGDEILGALGPELRLVGLKLGHLTRAVEIVPPERAAHRVR